MSDIDAVVAPMKHILDSFNNSLKLHMQPYGIRASDCRPEHLAMTGSVLDRVLTPIKGCVCGKDCAGGDRCTCTSTCCLGPGCCTKTKSCWCLPAAVAPTPLPCDIVETDDAYVLCMDLPEAKRENLRVECYSGHEHEHEHEHGHGHGHGHGHEHGEGHEHTHEHTHEHGQREGHHPHPHPTLSIGMTRGFDQTQTFLRKERPFGQMVRTFKLPDDVIVDEVSSKFDNGVLRVVIPRNQQAPAKRVQVKIS